MAVSFYSYSVAVKCSLQSFSKKGFVLSALTSPFYLFAFCEIATPFGIRPFRYRLKPVGLHAFLFMDWCSGVN